MGGLFGGKPLGDLSERQSSPCGDLSERQPSPCGDPFRIALPGEQGSRDPGGR